MTRNVFIFLGTFVAGAFIALVARAAVFKPHRAASEIVAPEYAAMVSNPTAPAPTANHDAHSSGQHDHSAPKAPEPSKNAKNADAPADAPVNTVCAICGMDVDPKLPTLEYKGKRIGFGCRMCPAKFKSDPDRYGPYYLRNEVINK